jgi:hypothetical protein
MQPGKMKLETPQSLLEHENLAGSFSCLQKRKIVYLFDSKRSGQK